MLYIHGYGSTGNAYKAKQLQNMFPERKLVAPTFDYNKLSPQEVLRQLQEIVEREQPELIVGSSTGGYYALCCSQFYRGPIWCVNPVHDIHTALDFAFKRLPKPLATLAKVAINHKLAQYEQFDREVFQQLQPLDGQLHFALSTDDEVLGDHRPLLERFPNHGTVVWKDNCGHRFFRFAELQPEIAACLATACR